MEEIEVTLMVEKVEKNGFKATLNVHHDKEAGSCIFTETYIVTGYERQDATHRAREVARMLGWKIVE